MFVLSVPFFLLGWLAPFQVLPGLPSSALGVVCPVLAASILTWRAGAGPGVILLLKRSFDYRRIRPRIWLVVAALLMPAVAVAVYGMLRSTGAALPSTTVPLFVPPLMLLMFFAAALGEELGWAAYATDPLQRRWGALQAGLILGIVWVVWHIIPFIEAGRAADWIAWQGLKTVALRVIMVSLYNNAGRSVFAVAVFHAMDNVSAFLFPTYGSHYDPRLTALILSGVALGIVIAWGPRTLARRTLR